MYAFPEVINVRYSIQCLRRFVLAAVIKDRKKPNDFDDRGEVVSSVVIRNDGEVAQCSHCLSFYPRKDVREIEGRRLDRECYRELYATRIFSTEGGCNREQ